MYMGQDQSNPYDIQSLGDRFNAAQDMRRSLGITTSYEIVSIQDLGPYAGDIDLQVSYSDGSSRRVSYSSLLGEVENAETIANMNVAAISTPGVVEQFATVGVAFTPLPPMNIQTEVIPPPGPIYASPTSFPSEDQTPEPVVPNAGLPSAEPMGISSPSRSWLPLALIAAGAYILGRR